MMTRSRIYLAVVLALILTLVIALVALSASMAPDMIPDIWLEIATVGAQLAVIVVVGGILTAELGYLDTVREKIHLFSDTLDNPLEGV